MVPGFVNPSMQNMKHRWELNAFSKVYTGLFKNNNLSLFSASTRISSQENDNFHNVGVYLYYDKEGNYINRYRSYIQYAYTLKLNARWYSSFGASIGGSSHKIGNADYIAGGQDNAVDGSIGISLYNDKSALALSVMQIPQGVIQPLVEQSVLRRYYNVFARKDITLSHRAALKNSLALSLYEDRPLSLIMTTGWVYDDLISVSVLYRWNKSLGVMLGLEKIKINKHELQMYLSYDINISKSYKNNSAELTLKYGLPRLGKVTKRKR